MGISKEEEVKLSNLLNSKDEVNKELFCQMYTGFLKVSGSTLTDALRTFINLLEYPFEEDHNHWSGESATLTGALEYEFKSKNDEIFIKIYNDTFGKMSFFVLLNEQYSFSVNEKYVTQSLLPPNPREMKYFFEDEFKQQINRRINEIQEITE